MCDFFTTNPNLKYKKKNFFFGGGRGQSGSGVSEGGWVVG